MPSHHRPASETQYEWQFRWRAHGGPLLDFTWGVSRDKTHFMNRLKTIYSSLFDPPLMNMNAESWSTLSGMVMVR